MSTVAQALTKIMNQKTFTKTMSLNELLTHSLKEIQGFDARLVADKAAAKLRLKSLSAPLKAAAEWLVQQELANTTKALGWEDTMSWQINVQVFEDPAQLMPVDAGTVDPRDNNVKPPSNAASNQADFMTAFKEMLLSLQTKAAEVPAAPVAVAAEPVSTEKTAEVPQEELVTWPLDIANKSFRAGQKSPEERNDFGADHAGNSTWMVQNNLQNKK